MKITINYRNPPAPEPMTLEEFADMHGLEMVVYERVEPVEQERRFCARFSGAEVKYDRGLITEFGDGATPEDAIAAYSRAILGKVLVTDSWTENHREMRCPMEWKPSPPR